MLYTTQQLLKAWRIYAGLEPVNNNCSIETFDSVDVDSVVAARLRQWYLDLLDSADSRLLGPPTDLTAKASLDGNRLTLDPTVRSVCSVRLSNWHRDAPIVDCSSCRRLISLMDNPYSAPGAYSPLALLRSPREIELAPVTNTSVIVSLRGYADSGDGIFNLEECAISKIPSLL